MLELVGQRDNALEKAWTQYLPGDYPPVTIASVVESANPFIVRANGMSPLIVMSEGLSSFVFGLVLTAILYAHEEHDAQECLRFMRQFMIAWLRHDAAAGPAGDIIQRLSTINLETTTYAVGLSNCVLTWAFYHELGHFRLGHLSRRTHLLHSASTTDFVVEGRTYHHSQELEADRFGIDRYLDLLAHEQQLRREFEIGRQADHAPIIGFELMNLAYKLYPDYDRRNSPSHPTPLDRAAALLAHAAGRFSTEGLDFYAYWRDLLAHIEEGLAEDDCIVKKRKARHVEP